MESPKTSIDHKFVAALVLYAVLAILAAFTLDGVIRIATWLFLGLFAVKTVIVVLKRRMD
ncbi:MAG: hypothetical protein ACRD2G_12320 [Terriglobia bacterium]